jgi:hypothetical protein
LHLEHWPCNSFSKGSYTCYRPGQFTSIADNEGTPVANLYFADEHASSFYEWQAFMEGAALPEYRQRNKSFKTSKPASSVEFCVCRLAVFDGWRRLACHALRSERNQISTISQRSITHLVSLERQTRSLVFIEVFLAA